MSVHFPTIAPHSILPVTQQGEEWVEREFIGRPDQDIRMLASHLTRPSGYLDMLLTGKIMTSREVSRLFGRVNTHRKGYTGENSTISFSSGHVSWKYGGDISMNSAKQYCGWGFMTSVEAVMQAGAISVSHCSKSGGVVDCLVQPHELPLCFHRIRRAAEMDAVDGYGDFLELLLRRENDKQLIQYDLNSGRMLIPLADRHDLLMKLEQRRADYERLAERLARSNFNYVFMEDEDREFYFLKESLEFFTSVLDQPLNFEALPVAYYEHSHLQNAMRQLSLIS